MQRDTPLTAEADDRSLGEIGLTRFAPYLMNRIIGRYNAALKEEIEAAGLTTAKARALGTLVARDGMLVGELSAHSVIEQSTMSRTLDQMEADGLISRCEDPADNRARRVHITEKGRAAFDTVWPSLRSGAEAFFDGIDFAEREAFLTTLYRIHLNLGRHPFYNRDD